MSRADDGSLRFGLFHAPFHSKRLNPTYALERDLLLREVTIDGRLGLHWFGPSVSYLQLLLHHSALGNPDVVAGGVFHQIHHFVGLADDIMRRFGIVRIGREANRSADVQVQPLFFTKVADAHGIAQAMWHGT